MGRFEDEKRMGLDVLMIGKRDGRPTCRHGFFNYLAICFSESPSPHQSFSFDCSRKMFKALTIHVGTSFAEFIMSDDNDSASSSSSYVPTTTLLAVPDGEIASSSKDLRSHTISWIGGYPTFPSLPSGSGSVPDKVNCGHCHNAIPLLAQVYAPPEGGENDRTVYVFACHRTACQRRAGR